MIEHKPRKESKQSSQPIYNISKQKQQHKERRKREQLEYRGVFGMKLFVFLVYFKGLLVFLVHQWRNHWQRRNGQPPFTENPNFCDASFFRAEISNQTRNGLVIEGLGFMNLKKTKENATPTWLQTPVC
ncbi:hypothetical protein RND71_005519 [Anisodus tanguticus]|uniref:Uncharacterized protein n=1 Tax=Anisodus tanguticus TaxID=243964 RepID=A0AAE1VMR8_9SOLA|nr:hypothetical protein RND71_005519 [Anisodus tanguticus]